jgi:GT2 family glycosyltransferase
MLATFMHDTTTVSLIIPTFNRARLIGQTIDSALAQTVPFHDIVVVDDGSTDDTARVLAAYGDRIKVVQHPRGGVQAARNAGAALAGGDFLTLCDSDDLLEPEFVAGLLACLRSHPDCNAFYSNFVTFNDDATGADKFSAAPPGFFDGAHREGDYLTRVPDLYARTVAFQPLFISGCTVSKELYRRLGGFDTRFNNVGGEDWEFTLRVLGAGQVALCTRPLVRIRKHASNQSGDSLRQVRGTAHILEHALDHHPGAAGCRDIIIRSIEARRLSVFHVAFGRGNFAVAEEMLGLLRSHPTSPKFRIKRFITRLPAVLRQAVWSVGRQRPGSNPARRGVGHPAS